jgi:FtsH-binding integral membrane protein
MKKLMRKIWNVCYFNLPVVIFTVLWIGLYMFLIELNVLPTNFAILVIWMAFWLFIVIWLAAEVEKRIKNDS